MRVGSFILLREPSVRGFDAIHSVPRRTRYAYYRRDRMEALEWALHFIRDNRQDGDPDAWEILCAFWPDLRREMTDWLLKILTAELADFELPEEPNGQPPF